MGMKKSFINCEKMMINQYIESLCQRILLGGGFPAKAGGKYRPDATAWAILALTISGTKEDALESSRARLVSSQLSDGRVCLLPEHPDAYWPTPLAVLAWQGSPAHLDQQSRAIEFLINNTGKHWPRKPDDSERHDTNIRGWPWTANTHSWVEPTALSVIALQVAGYGNHERAREATRMLMDRQLSRGGWNYGNTIVFGQELRPMPENTGMALNALAGRVAEGSIKVSLEYLQIQASSLHTPLSLAWCLMGLGAWVKGPDNAKEQILDSLSLQKNYGNYATPLLSLLIVSYFSNRGITKSLYKPVC
jgi:hypothetical protein